MDLNIIGIMFKVGKVLALTPQSQDNQKSNNFQKLYAIVVFLLCTVCFVMNMSYRTLFYDDLSSVQLLLFVFTDVDRYLHNVYTLIIVMIFKQKEWFKLITNLRKTCVKASKTSQLLTFVMSHAAFLVLFVFVFHISVRSLGFAIGIQLYFLEYIQFYCQFYYMLFSCIILKMLLLRYSYQKFLLHEEIKMIQKRSFYRNSKSLKKIQCNIFCLKESADIFSDIFGGSILLNIFFNALKSLIYLERIIKNGYLGGMSIVSLGQIGIMVFFWTGTIVTVLRCDAVLKKFVEILRLSMKLEVISSDMTKDKNDQIRSFIDVVLHNRPKFTAFRFFEVNRSTIFRILYSIVTFLIIMIQFKLN
ncbi:7tm 7 domain containing protein [Asbolus verrucosus]|uniref:Gustatory receptor n=1 Tax=Asbolus verrucosus TaxID=1661398 RepID=A0A482VLP4_ASBVE|nr:7tm 7 domain containing protein [Asbolus verrucosus]